MDLNDIFGQMPARPDHPDFWKLSEIVLRMDGQMQEADEAAKERLFHEEVTAHIDEDSLGYMAIQRAFRVLGITTAGEARARTDELTPQIQMFIDAFLMGCNFKAAKLAE